MRAKEIGSDKVLSTIRNLVRNPNAFEFWPDGNYVVLVYSCTTPIISMFASKRNPNDNTKNANN